MSDQTSRPQPATTTADATAPTGDRWGDDIPEARVRELEKLLAAWEAEADHGDRKGPFDNGSGKRRGVPLTGADVFYLAARALGATSILVADLAAAREALRAVRKDFSLHYSLNLSVLHLEGATLRQAHLERAYLVEAHLERAFLSGAHLEGATLRSASLDKTTHLNDATLTGTSLDQITFDNANLTVVKWARVAPLGDELRACAPKTAKRKPKDRVTRLAEFEAAVRANRVLAVALRAQGMSDDADIFAYRAQVLQRQLYFRQRQFGRWLFSALLAVLSGYGYRLGNIFRAYALVVLAFAAGYLIPIVASGALPTGQAAANALQISLNAIHGRVFFAQFTLDTLQSWLATAESVVGIVIEGVFVAMLIQRLFR
jgi:hypothetical protein